MWAVRLVAHPRPTACPKAKGSSVAGMQDPVSAGSFQRFLSPYTIFEETSPVIYRVKPVELSSDIRRRGVKYYTYFAYWITTEIHVLKYNYYYRLKPYKHRTEEWLAAWRSLPFAEWYICETLSKRSLCCSLYCRRFLIISTLSSVLAPITFNYHHLYIIIIYYKFLPRPWAIIVGGQLWSTKRYINTLMRNIMKHSMWKTTHEHSCERSSSPL